MTLAFTPWPKTPRLFRDATITEKIDGTNAAVVIKKIPFSEAMTTPLSDVGAFACHWTADTDGPDPEYAYLLGAQSRNRLIGPASASMTDNMGFAAWVQEHGHNLVRQLGEGVHFGEWWGHGIQRGYGLAQGDRRFSLFNVHRYSKMLPTHPEDPRPRVPGLGVVPILSQHTFSTELVQRVKGDLIRNGSVAAPDFMRPEGVIVFHSAANQVFKSLIEGDDVPKGA